MVNNDRAKTVGVKMKDKKLYTEIKDIFYQMYRCNYGMSYCPEKIHNNLIVPNKKVLSTMKDIDEYCILHHAVRTFTRYTEFILEMIEMFPNAIQVPNKDGEYMLHLSIKHKQSETVIMKLIEVFPHAVQVPDNKGEYVLLDVIRHDQSETVALKIIELVPQAIEVLSVHGNYAIELAIYNKNSDTTVLKMLELYPQVIEKMNDRRIDFILRKATMHYSKSEKCIASPSENLVLEKLNQLISNKKRMGKEQQLIVKQKSP